MNNIYDAIVVGLGAMGSASIYQLSKLGLKVLGIDQFSPPHNLGSTHGPTRILRLAIGEGAHYTPLSQGSYELFKQLERDTDSNLLETTGMLIISNVDSKVIQPEGHFFGNTVAAAQRYDIKHDILNASEIRRRFPQFKVKDNEQAYFEYEAGYLRPEEIVKAQLKLAQKNGATIQTEETMNSFNYENDKVIVRTNKGNYYAEKLVLSLGPWLANSIDEAYKTIFKVQRLAVCWFDIKNSFANFKAGNCPIYFWQLPGYDQWLYGFPAIDGPQGGLQVATTDCSSYLPADPTPDSVNRNIQIEEINTMYDKYISPFLQGVNKQVIRTSVCIYTSTPDGEFIIDKHPLSSRVIVCSPCSGHGFKHSAAIGECIAQIIAQDKTNVDISRFSFDRLEKIISSQIHR